MRAGDGLGYDLVAVDPDGDGVDALAVGVPAWSVGPLRSGLGGARVHLFEALSGTVVPTDSDQLVVDTSAGGSVGQAVAALTAEGPVLVGDDWQAGYVVVADAGGARSTVGGVESDACGADVGVADVDGSGTPDIVAACLNAPLEEVGSVEVYTRRGASDWDAIGWLEGTQAYGWFGRPAVGGFDLGADGVPELALGEQHVDDTLRSVVHVIEGPWRGHCTLEALGARRLWNDYVPARLTTGDLDGDGVKELVATEAGQPAWRAEATVGQVRVVRDVVIEDTDADAASWLTFEGAVPEESFGADAAVGDFNGDGCADVAVGAPGFAAAGGPGRVYVFHGPFAGGTVPLGAAQVVLEGAADGDGFGGRLEVGDFDGDGVDDLAVAAPYDGRAAWEAGAVYVLAAVRP